MRRWIILVVLALLPQAVLAQSLFDAARGKYGSATDPATSCAVNPHEMAFMTQPPHVMLTWTQPKLGPNGQMRAFERYDIEDYDGTTMTLREEGDFRPDQAGGPYWVLQMTETPSGYCWRRPDWPQVRCEDQQLRCEAPVS